jgi:hypothetical protein
MLLGGTLAHPRAAILRFFLAREQLIGTSLGVLGRFLLVMKYVFEPMVATAIGAGLWRSEDEKRGEDQHRLAAILHLDSPLRNFRARECQRSDRPADSKCS